MHVCAQSKAPSLKHTLPQASPKYPGSAGGTALHVPSHNFVPLLVLPHELGKDVHESP